MRSVLMGAALAVSLAAAAWGETWTIEPGVGVGPIKIGQDMLAPTKLLTPYRKLAGTLVGSPGIYLTYKEGLETDCQANRIIMIVVKPGVEGRTLDVVGPGGVKLGSSGPVQGVFGPGVVSHNLPTAKGDPQKTYYAWPNKGVGVITEGGKVIQFDVFARK